jgi:hypothetical protein
MAVELFWYEKETKMKVINQREKNKIRMNASILSKRNERPW